MSDDILFETLEKMGAGSNECSQSLKIKYLSRIAFALGVLMMALFAASSHAAAGPTLNAAVMIVSTLFVGISIACVIACFSKEMRSGRPRAY